MKLLNKSYWNGNGKYENLAKELQEMIPASGKCSISEFEEFRIAQNCYYDLYNNGLCNRAVEFRKVFGFSGRKRYHEGCPKLFPDVEKRMDEIISSAHKKISSPA